jgi:hypothetical protein
MSLERELARDLRKYRGIPVEYSAVERAVVLGIYTFECRSAKGERLWKAKTHNIITGVGWAFMWDHTLQTPVAQVGPFMGLIGGAGAPTIVTGDTMVSHAGWLEAGLANPPTYTAPRKTTVGQWSAAVAATRTKALSTAQVYAITGTGNVTGAFMVIGSGAVSTLDNTAGILFSAGAMTLQPVVLGNNLSVSWSIQGT